MTCGVHRHDMRRSPTSTDPTCYKTPTNGSRKRYSVIATKPNSSYVRCSATFQNLCLIYKLLKLLPTLINFLRLSYASSSYIPMAYLQILILAQEDLTLEEVSTSTRPNIARHPQPSYDSGRSVHMSVTWIWLILLMVQKSG